MATAARVAEKRVVPVTAVMLYSESSVPHRFTSPFYDRDSLGSRTAAARVARVD